MEDWDELLRLPTPWPEVLRLAWKSFRDGNYPVGAVVVGPDGEIVASGRSQRFSAHRGRGSLAGTSLAHAEMNALTKLPRGQYHDHSLYSSLRPCFLCTAAIVQCRVGHVWFAGDDPVVAGVQGLPELSPQMARRWPSWKQAPNESLINLCLLLPIAFEYEQGRDNDVRLFEHDHPAIAALARRLLDEGDLTRLRNLPLATALEHLSDLGL